jgi:hypothetical protein
MSILLSYTCSLPSLRKSVRNKQLRELTGLGGWAWPDAECGKVQS